MIQALGGILNALGAAGGAAGALGATQVASGLTSLQKALGGVNAVLQPAQQAFEKTGQALKASAVAAADFASAPLKLLTQAIQGFNAPALAAIGTLNELQNAITAVGKALTPFVALASPATTSQFQRAANDLTASIGRALTPALEMATKFVRAFADVIFVASGPINRLTRALQPLADVLPRAADALAPMARRFEEIVKLLIEIIQPLAKVGASHAVDVLQRVANTLELVYKVTKPVIEVMTEMARVFGQLYQAIARNPFGQALRRGIGFGPSVTPEVGAISGKSVGAAVAPAQIGSVEGALSKALTSAFSLCSASGTPEERSASSLDRISALLTSWTTVFEQIPARIADAIGRAPRELVGRIGDAARDNPAALSSPGSFATAMAARWAAENFSFGGR